jgi:hypothetical protein
MLPEGLLSIQSQFRGNYAIIKAFAGDGDIARETYWQIERLVRKFHHIKLWVGSSLLRLK